MMTDYAFRILRCFTVEQQGYITTVDIAKKECLSHGIVIKILALLRRGGIITSHRGRGGVSGGYSLAMPLAEVTFLTVIELMEGPVTLDLKQKDNDIIGNELNQLEKVIRDELDKKTLADVIFLS